MPTWLTVVLIAFAVHTAIGLWLLLRKPLLPERWHVMLIGCTLFVLAWLPIYLYLLLETEYQKREIRRIQERRKKS